MSPTPLFNKGTSLVGEERLTRLPFLGHSYGCCTSNTANSLASPARNYELGDSQGVRHVSCSQAWLWQ